jgi:hypothetical protein
MIQNLAPEKLPGVCGLATLKKVPSLLSLKSVLVEIVKKK